MFAKENMKKKDKKSSLSKIKCDFSFRHYREILDLFKKKGYKFCFFSELSNQKVKRVYLRHDVEISLEKALQLAQIEHQKEVSSTYFVRFSAPFYNVFDPTYSKMIKKIIGLNHQLGLHFEGDIYGNVNLNKKAIEREVSRQLQTLKQYFEIQSVVSFHHPSNFTSNNQKFKDFISTYHSKFFQEIKYLSDSKGEWREGCVCQWLKSSSPPQNLQILTHPVWWGRKERNLNKYLKYYLKEKLRYLDKSLFKDIKDYRKNF